MSRRARPPRSCGCPISAPSTPASAPTSSSSPRTRSTISRTPSRLTRSTRAGRRSTVPPFERTGDKEGTAELAELAEKTFFVGALRDSSREEGTAEIAKTAENHFVGARPAGDKKERRGRNNRREKFFLRARCELRRSFCTLVVPGLH